MTPEAAEWLALLRAHEGGLTKLDHGYLNYGRPVAHYLTDVLDELVRTDYLVVGQPTPIGQRQVRVTRAGQDRYAHLCQAHRASHHRSGAS